VRLRIELGEIFVFEFLGRGADFLGFLQHLLAFFFDLALLVGNEVD